MTNNPTTTKALLEVAEGRGVQLLPHLVAFAKDELARRGVHWAGSDCWCEPVVEIVPPKDAS